VSAILLSGLGGKYWKPIQSGLDDITDTQWIKEKTGLPDSCFYPEAYRLKLPLSPHASATSEGKRIDLAAFETPVTSEGENLIIEGAGGVMVPLNEKELMTDLIKKLYVPVLLVSRSSLGTINHTLLSLNQMRREGIEIFGVVMNGEKDNSNREAIEHYGNVKVLAEIENLEEINPNSLKKCFNKEFV
jgi:dethiobiotin synthase